MWKERDIIVPVIMFHSVGLDKYDWVFRHLSEPLELFEEKIEYLARCGYQTILWEELYRYMKGDIKIPRKSIMLTFDDGYLDNWVYVYPILKKYGMKGTIFVSPEFVDPSEKCRPSLKDVWDGKINANELKPAGFLCWSEMREMERNGIMDIQSHALTHTWYFSSNKIIDFHRPDDGYVWLAWNKYPERKFMYLEEKQDNLIRNGIPIYTFEKSLITRRYFEDPQLSQVLADFVSENGGEKFFEQYNWKENLFEVANNYKKKYKLYDSMESEEEYKKRVYYELAHSKRLIEDSLDKRVRFLCFPGGGYNENVLQIAKDVGYLSTTLSSRDQSRFRNKTGLDPFRIKRISSATRFTYKGRKFGFASPRYFISCIESHKGSFPYRLLGWFYKLIHILTYPGSSKEQLFNESIFC